ncbi:MAG: phosphoglycolate phosphatase [Methylotenera sp.]
MKAVMVDLDGTLIHTAPEIAWAINAMLVDIGQPPLAMEQIEAFIGEGASALIKRCLTNEASDKLSDEPNAELFVKAQKLFFAHYARVVIKSKPYAGVVEALQDLNSAGYRLACVTNKSQSFTLPLLEANDLLQYFELVVSGDTLPKKKPEPDQIFYICEKFGVLVSEAVLVGDSKTDIAAARNAGCYVFVVPYGYNQGCEIAASSVDALINHLSEVQGLIN